MTGNRIIADSWEQAEKECKKGFVYGVLVSEEDIDGGNKISYE